MITKRSFHEVAPYCNFVKFDDVETKFFKPFFAFKDANTGLYTEPFSASCAEHAVMLVLNTINSNDEQNKYFLDSAPNLTLECVFAYDYATGEVFSNTPLVICNVIDMLPFESEDI